ncbi:hypothetical protein SDJN02_15394, partial [Cucurbita argyrosperma subsp. argyrosperma]
MAGCPMAWCPKRNGEENPIQPSCEAQATRGSKLGCFNLPILLICSWNSSLSTLFICLNLFTTITGPLVKAAL